MRRDKFYEPLKGFGGLGLDDSRRLTGARLAEIEDAFVRPARQIFSETRHQAVERLGFPIVVQGQRDALHEKPPKAPSQFPSRLSLRLLQGRSKSGAINLSKFLTSRRRPMSLPPSTRSTGGAKPRFNRN